MPALFDNIDDVSSKFAGTICYYDKKPVLVKQVANDEKNPGQFMLLIISTVNGRGKYVSLTDPALNYKDYNLGYANTGYIAPWYYRRPLKQYRQGLKRDQLGFKLAVQMQIDDMFQYSKPYIAMLENNYPDLEVCKEVLTDGKVKVIAFNRDFAICFDRIHEDFILEYRGKHVGVSLNKHLTEYRLMPESSHLRETLQEALP